MLDVDDEVDGNSSSEESGDSSDEEVDTMKALMSELGAKVEDPTDSDDDDASGICGDLSSVSDGCFAEF